MQSVLPFIRRVAITIAGKSAERPILSEENIEHNVQSIQILLQRLLSQGSQQELPAPLMLNNLDWFGAMPLLTFLRQVYCVSAYTDDLCYVCQLV